MNATQDVTLPHAGAPADRAVAPVTPVGPAVLAPPYVRVRDVMTRTVATVEPGATIAEILDLMIGRTISGVPVVDRHGTLLGVVTQSDLLRDAGTARATDAAGVMSADLVTAAPDEPLADAAARMVSTGRKRLLVVDDGRLVGIIARRDLLRAFHRPEQTERTARRGEVTEEFKVLMTNPTGWQDARETHFWG